MAFRDCASLRSVTISDNLTLITYNAFDAVRLLRK
ncbi:MAG: leucine-rich repeat domain-containing protein [Muribaculaceae bacterium]|nr:leucine-rich repeat domain-containing protein [Muribaculaceae bacterium]